jgi:hypothetical protein
VKSVQKIEEGKTNEVDLAESPKNHTVAEQIHNEEQLFVRRVFPHIISLPADDLGLNL